MRHGFGIRTSAAYSIAAKHRSHSNNTHASLTSLRSNYASDTNYYPEHSVGNSARSKDKRNDVNEKGIKIFNLIIFKNELKCAAVLY